MMSKSVRFSKIIFDFQVKSSVYAYQCVNQKVIVTTGLLKSGNWCTRKKWVGSEAPRPSKVWHLPTPAFNGLRLRHSRNVNHAQNFATTFCNFLTESQTVLPSSCSSFTLAISSQRLAYTHLPHFRFRLEIWRVLFHY